MTKYIKTPTEIKMEYIKKITNKNKPIKNDSKSELKPKTKE